MLSLGFWLKKSKVSPSAPVTPSERYLHNQLKLEQNVSGSKIATEMPQTSEESTRRKQKGAKTFLKWCFWRKKNRVHPAPFTDSDSESTEKTGEQKDLPIEEQLELTSISSSCLNESSSSDIPKETPQIDMSSQEAWYSSRKNKNKVFPVASDDRAEELQSITESQIMNEILTPRDQLLRTKWLMLPNLGGSCFANSSLQCLFRAETFCEELCDLLDKYHDEPKSRLRAILRRCTKAQKTPLAPEGLISCFAALWKMRISAASQDMGHTRSLLRDLIDSFAEFSTSDGNDPIEFLCECLKQMEKSLRKLSWGNNTPPRCPVRSNFMIKMRNITTCSSCGSQEKDELEELYYLSLPLVHPSVDKCLSSIVNNPRAVPDKCKVCGGESASLVETFHTLPKFLILKLERVKEIKDGSLIKLKNTMAIDTELQLTASEQSCTVSLNNKNTDSPSSFSQTNPPQKESGKAKAKKTDKHKPGGSAVTYRLIGILSITGKGLDSGHALTDCFINERREWITYDDCFITLTTEKQVLKTRSTLAYMLLYERVGTG